MPLQRTDTGETAAPLSKPLQELRERNDLTKEQYDTALLKEALATSNEKCNGLIKEQNMLVREMRSDIAMMDYNSQMTVNKAVKQMESIQLSTYGIQVDIRQIVRAETASLVNELKDHGKNAISESLSEVRKELSATVKEIEKQREEYKLQGFFRKLLFWATPVLLLVQTILLIILMN